MSDGAAAVTDSQPDPITVLRVHKAEHPPGMDLYYLCPRALAARLQRDVRGSGDEVTDLGPDALMYAQTAKPAEFHRDGHRYMVLVGVTRGGKWELWTPPAPVEPVPGSAASRAAQQ